MYVMYLVFCYAAMFAFCYVMHEWYVRLRCAMHAMYCMNFRYSTFVMYFMYVLNDMFILCCVQWRVYSCIFIYVFYVCHVCQSCILCMFCMLCVLSILCIPFYAMLCFGLRFPL